MHWSYIGETLQQNPAKSLNMLMNHNYIASHWTIAPNPSIGHTLLQHIDMIKWQYQDVLYDVTNVKPMSPNVQCNVNIGDCILLVHKHQTTPGLP